MMNFCIGRLQSLMKKGMSNLLGRVVCSLVVGLCVVVRKIGREIERICQKCSGVIADVRTAFCALREEFAPLCPIGVLANYSDAMNPPKQYVTKGSATARLWLRTEGPPRQHFAYYPQPPTGASLSHSSAQRVLSWHHPPTFLSSSPFVFL